MFTVKYYKEVIREGRVKKILECTKAELLPILVVCEENNDNEDIAARRNEMENAQNANGGVENDENEDYGNQEFDGNAVEQEIEMQE